MISGVKPTKSLDATGLYCPEPVIRTKVEIGRMKPGEVLEVLADDPVAEEDIKSWSERMGHEFLGVKMEGNTLRLLVRKAR